MFQIISGLNDMIKKFIVHRDIKLENIMLHFPQQNFKFGSRDERRKFLKIVNLEKTPFSIKIADFGYSKKL